MKKITVVALFIWILFSATTVAGYSLGTKFFGSEGDKMVFDTCERSRGWTGGVAVTNLTVTTQHIQGEMSLTFGKIAGATNAFIEKSIGRYKLDAADCNLEMQFYISSIAKISGITADLGSSTNNYARYSISDVILCGGGWREIKFELKSPTLQVGDGMDTDAISWLRFGVAFDAATNTLSDIRIDELTWRYKESAEPKILCFYGDYSSAQADQLIFSPSSGKRLVIIEAYASSKVNTTDIILKFATSNSIFFRLYTSLQGSAVGNEICGVGDTDEGVELTCGNGGFVSISYKEID